MTPKQAGALVRRARRLLRAGRLTHHQLVLLDCLVWSCRTPGADRLTVSYSRLQRLAHMARDTVASGIRRLGALGLLRKIKRRVRVVWRGGTASRQATNIYVLSTESDQPPVSTGLEKKESALEQALSRLGALVAAAAAPDGSPLRPGA